MKSTTPSTRAPRQKAGESDSAFQKRTAAYYKAKEIRDYENRNPDLEPEQGEDAYITALAAQIEEEASLALSNPEDEDAQFASRHHNPTPYLDLKPAPEPLEAPQKAAIDPARFHSRLDELLDRVGGLERLMDKLARLIAATMPARTLKPAAKAAVLQMAPELAEAYRDDRVREICETYEHVVNMGYAKKRSANFPRALDDRLDLTGYRPEDSVICRVIPYSALIARCSAKKAFRVVAGEDSAVQNVKLACIKAGMVVTTLDKAGMKRGSHVQVIMDHAEAVKRGLVKGLEPVGELPKVEPELPPHPRLYPDRVVDKLPPKPRATFDKAAWEEPEPDGYVEPEGRREAEEKEAAEIKAKLAASKRVDIHHPTMNNDAPPAKIDDYRPSVQAAIKRGNPRFSGWDEENDTTPIPDEVLTTTTSPVDDEIDTEPWEEEEDDGYNEDPIALFRESGEQEKKSSRAVDLFAD